MKISTTSRYATPSIEIVDVVVEAGFINSLGELTFDDASEGGEYGF